MAHREPLFNSSRADTLKLGKEISKIAERVYLEKVKSLPPDELWGNKPAALLSLAVLDELSPEDYDTFEEVAKRAYLKTFLSRLRSKDRKHAQDLGEAPALGSQQRLRDVDPDDAVEAALDILEHGKGLEYTASRQIRYVGRNPEVELYRRELQRQQRYSTAA